MKKFTKTISITPLAVLVVFVLININKSLEKDITFEDLKDSLITVDKEFCRIALSKGTGEAFISFAAPDVILMRQGSESIIGIDALKKHYETKSLNPPVLSWKPLKADISASGDLGYTYGKWELNVKLSDDRDTTFYGVYSTIWKRQPDGSWKFVLDCGTSTSP